MIMVIDYGVGNVGSIMNMLKKIGADSMLSGHPSDIELADKIILPGVGSFDSAMQKLLDSGLIEYIKAHALSGKPTLGICLGMQMLGRCSEEGHLDGLGLIPFDTIRFQFEEIQNLKIPHMGWDVVAMEQRNDPILGGIEDTQKYYFAHSYHARCDNIDNVLLHCEYGYTFPAAVKSGRTYGFQFHPEKSHRYGMALLSNFVWRV